MLKPITLPSDSTSKTFQSTALSHSPSLSLTSLTSPRRSPSHSPSSLTSPRAAPFSVTCRSAVQDPPQISNSKSLYDVLRVERNATPMEIKTAYRRLAKMYHPDAMTSPTDEMSDGRDFIEIRNAYETLSDPAARAVYDLSLGFGGRRRGERLTSIDDLAAFRHGSRRPACSPTRRWESDQCW